MICEAKLLYGVEIWGVKKGWEIIDKIQGKYCKRVLRWTVGLFLWVAGRKREIWLLGKKLSW